MPSGFSNYKISAITEDSPFTAIIESDTEYAFAEEVAVVPSTETDLATITALTGQTLLVRHVFAETCVDAIFRVYLGSTKVWQARNAWTDRNVRGDLLVQVGAGETVKVTVEHANSVSQPASAGLYLTDISSSA